MTPGVLLITYSLALTGAILIVGLIDYRRNKKFDPASTPDHVFRCEQCGTVYTDDPDVECSRCPQCGMMNERIVF